MAENNKPVEETIAEWSVHRIREQPRKLAILLPTLLAANLLMFFLLLRHGKYSFFFLLVGNAILAGSLSDLLFPIKFRLTAEGAFCRNLILKKEIFWKNVKNCYLTGQSIKLSPLDKMSRLENFRGFELFFNGNREEIIEHVRHLAANRQK